MRNDSRLSRRRLLASVPAVAATMGPAAASFDKCLGALGGLATGSDPIFAAIERHRQAFEAYNDAHELYRRLQEEHKAQRNPCGVYLGEVPETEPVVNYADGRRCKLDNDHLPTGDGDTWTIAPTGRTVPRYAVFPPEIDNNVPDDCADPEAWKAEKYAEWRQWHGGAEGSPVSLAYDAWNAASRPLIEVTAGLDTRPSTLAGAVALLRHVAGFLDDEVWTMEDDGDSRLSPLVDDNRLFKGIIETLAEVVESVHG